MATIYFLSFALFLYMYAPKKKSIKINICDTSKTCDKIYDNANNNSDNLLLFVIFTKVLTQTDRKKSFKKYYKFQFLKKREREKSK